MTEFIQSTLALISTVLGGVTALRATERNDTPRTIFGCTMMVLGAMHLTLK